jgi:O-antigen/teichoic acid export membrane protein
MTVTRNQLYKDSFWASVSAVSNTLFGVLYLIMIGNYWKSEGLGIFFLSLSLYIIGSTICNIGIHNATLYRVASSGKDAAQASLAAYTGIVISLVLGVSGGVILFFCSSFLSEFFHHEHVGIMMKLYASALPLFLVNKTMSEILNAHLRMRLLAGTQILRGLILCVYITNLIYFRLSYITIPIGVILSEIFIFFILLSACIRTHKPSFPSMKVAKKLLDFGWKTSLLNIIADLDLRIDILFIGFFSDISRVGIYSIASSIAKAFWILPNAIQKVTNPLIVSLYSEGNMHKIHRVLDVLLRLGTILFFFIGCFLVIMAKPMLHIFYPGQSDLISSAYPLYLLLPGTVIFTGIAMVASAPCASIGRPENSVKYISVRIMANFVMNLILVPFLFDKGAAIATTFAIVISVGFYAHLFKKYLMFSFPLKKLLLLFIIFCALIYLKISFEPLTILHAILFFLIIAALSTRFYYSGFIHRGDKELLCDLLNVPGKS